MEVAMEVPVAIVGGGLAGLALAVALHERSIPFLVFEKSPALRNSASTIFALFKNGSRALDGIRPGLSSLMKSAGVQIDTSTTIIIEGHEKPTISDRHPQELYIIAWAAAQKLLASLIPSENIVFGHRFISYEAVEGGVKAEFEVNHNMDSSIISRIVHTKLLIGADGLWSFVRKNLYNDQPRYTHQVYWNAITCNLNDMFKKQRTGLLVSIRDKPQTTKAVMLGSDSGYYFWNIRTLDADDNLGKVIDENNRSDDRLSCKARALEVIGRLGGWDELKMIVQATQSEKISERKIMDHIPLRSWSGAAGHVLLIGDAAHAMHYGPGQGAMTSFEDAHQLSNLLDATFSSSNTMTVADAVLRFETMRVPRLIKIQEYSAESSEHIDLRPSWRVDLSEEQTKTRSDEFAKWVTAYPEKMDADPDSHYWS